MKNIALILNILENTRYQKYIKGKLTGEKIFWYYNWSYQRPNYEYEVL